MIAFVGAPVPEAALLAAPLSAFAPKIIKSIKNHTLRADIAILARKIFELIKRIIYQRTWLVRLVMVKRKKAVLRRIRRKRKFYDDS